jgi:putative zinc finger/helix-turn-helix YgiT family protein
MTEIRPSAATSVVACPVCASEAIETRNETIDFPYGVGANAVTLQCEVPVHQCRNCGSEFEAEASERIRDQTIRAHLKQMTAREIRQVRESIQLSRRQFAEISRIGAASLARWETGELIPNAAYDHYLYLLSFVDNVTRLRARVEGFTLNSVTLQIGAPRFNGRALDSAKVMQLQDSARTFCPGFRTAEAH